MSKLNELVKIIVIVGLVLFMSALYITTNTLARFITFINNKVQI